MSSSIISPIELVLHLPQFSHLLLKQSGEKPKPTLTLLRAFECFLGSWIVLNLSSYWLLPRSDCPYWFPWFRHYGTQKKNPPFGGSIL